MQELIPFGCGLLLGAALGWVRPSIRLPLGALLAIAMGVFATVVTGEFKLSWDYLLVDIPLVAVAAFAGFAALRRTAAALGRSPS
jgi:hypothetical protein